MDPFNRDYLLVFVVLSCSKNLAKSFEVDLPVDSPFSVGNDNTAHFIVEVELL